MPEEQEDNNIEGFSSTKNEFSKQGLVMEAIRSCRVARSQEMKAGFWNEKITKDGSPIRMYIGDTRKIFISNMEALKSLLAPEILADTSLSFKTFTIKFEADTKRLFELYAYHEVEYNYEKKTSFTTGRIYLPDLDASIPVGVSHDPYGSESEVEYERGKWNSYVNAYWDNMVLLYDKLFAELAKLIDRTHNFKKKLVRDGVEVGN